MWVLKRIDAKSALAVLTTIAFVMCWSWTAESLFVSSSASDRLSEHACNACTHPEDKKKQPGKTCRERCIGIASFEKRLASHGSAGLRAVLSAADGRLNKERQDSGLAKFQCRGVPRFIAPLRKSLLCNPGGKSKPTAGKKAATEALTTNQTAKKNLKLAVKGTSSVSLDERATVLLMKTSGLVKGREPLSDELQEQFGGQFVYPLEEELVGGMRTAFGIAGEGGMTVLDALVGDDEA